MNQQKSFLLLFWVFAFALILHSLTLTKETQAAPSWEQKANKVITLAKKKKKEGAKYVNGKDGPNEFDCSGFTKYIYEKAITIQLPHSSKGQAKQGKTIEKSKIRKGDLLFFNTNGEGISHVGIYIGNGEMIHAANKDKHIIITKLSESYWKKRYVKAQRVFE